MGLVQECSLTFPLRTKDKGESLRSVSLLAWMHQFTVPAHDPALVNPPHQPTCLMFQKRTQVLCTPDLRIFSTSKSVSCILNSVQILDKKKKRKNEKKIMVVTVSMVIVIFVETEWLGKAL